jgi:hypothetical protein
VREKLHRSRLAEQNQEEMLRRSVDTIDCKAKGTMRRCAMIQIGMNNINENARTQRTSNEDSNPNTAQKSQY